MVVSPDGKYLFSGSNNKTMCEWLVESGEMVQKLDLPDNIWGMAVLPNTKVIPTHSKDTTIFNPYCRAKYLDQPKVNASDDQDFVMVEDQKEQRDILTMLEYVKDEKMPPMEKLRKILSTYYNRGKYVKYPMNEVNSKFYIPKKSKESCDLTVNGNLCGMLLIRLEELLNDKNVAPIDRLGRILYTYQYYDGQYFHLNPLFPFASPPLLTDVGNQNIIDKMVGVIDAHGRCSESSNNNIGPVGIVSINCAVMHCATLAFR